jgi:hypothetical protein
MSEYCQKFGLVPSETPQVVTTTRHPDSRELGDRVVANLNGDEDTSAHALAILTDQLLKTGISQRNLDSREGWSQFVSGATAVVSATGCYLNKVSFSIKTGFFNAEIVHDKPC